MVPHLSGELFGQVVDDPDFMSALAAQRNLPDFVKESLPPLYD
jgi:hypothetical protein